jgi:para-nitrobenzyl esterase
MRTNALLAVIFTNLAALCATVFAQAANDGSSAAIPKVAIVETNSGKLQGSIHGRIFSYKGVPYAQAARFMPPAKVEPWIGIRDALAYGDISPQSGMFVQSNSAIPQNYWPESENCQFLNVWTPGIGAGQKRPVMVWLHGGGFSSGASNADADFDGENLSRTGDELLRRRPGSKTS